MRHLLALIIVLFALVTETAGQAVICRTINLEPFPMVQGMKFTELFTHSDPPYYDFAEITHFGPHTINATNLAFSEDEANHRQYVFGEDSRMPTVWEPGKSCIIDTLSLVGRRLSRTVEWVVLTNQSLPKTDPNYIVDQQKVPSLFNMGTYQHWWDSYGGHEWNWGWLSINFQRYPNAGPWSITEIAYRHPTCQYVRLTCLHSNQITNPNGTCITSMGGNDYQLRFSDTEDVYNYVSETSFKYMSPNLAIPTLYVVGHLQHVYLTSCTSDQFSKAFPSLSSSVVVGPWSGTLDSTQAKTARVRLTGNDAKVDSQQWLESVPYDPSNGRWPKDPGGDTFIIAKVNYYSTSIEPRNWKLQGQVISCDHTKGAESCPYIDRCSRPVCQADNTCTYEMFSKLHPEYDWCFRYRFCDDALQYFDTVNQCMFAEENSFGKAYNTYTNFGCFDIGKGSRKCAPYFNYYSLYNTRSDLDCYPLGPWTPVGTCWCNSSGLGQQTYTRKVWPAVGQGKACSDNKVDTCSPCQTIETSSHNHVTASASDNINMSSGPIVTSIASFSSELISSMLHSTSQLLRSSSFKISGAGLLTDGNHKQSSSQAKVGSTMPDKNLVGWYVDIAIEEGNETPDIIKEIFMKVYGLSEEEIMVYETDLFPDAPETTDYRVVIIPRQVGDYPSQYLNKFYIQDLISKKVANPLYNDYNQASIAALNITSFDINRGFPTFASQADSGPVMNVAKSRLMDI